MRDERNVYFVGWVILISEKKSLACQIYSPLSLYSCVSVCQVKLDFYVKTIT